MSSTDSCSSRGEFPDLDVTITDWAMAGLAFFSQQYKSIVGIHIFTLGVRGDYVLDGRVQSKWSNPRSANYTFALWSVKNVKPMWSSTSSYQSNLRITATFTMGVSTQWFKVRVQTFDKELNCVVRT